MFESWILKNKLLGIDIDYTQVSSGEVILRKVQGKSIKKFIVPEEVIEIGDHCFENFDMSQLVIKGEDCVFCDSSCACLTSLKSVVCNNVKFKGCVFRNNINLAEFNCKSFEFWDETSTFSFAFCESLKNIDFSKFTGSFIPTSTFRGCNFSEVDLTKLSNITLGDWCFSSNSNLKHVKLSKVYLSDDCFCDCVNLETVEFDNILIADNFPANVLGLSNPNVNITIGNSSNLFKEIRENEITLSTFLGLDSSGCKFKNINVIR